MSIPLSDNILVGQQKPIEARSYNGLDPYINTTQANLIIVPAVRHTGLIVYVQDPINTGQVIEYWYQGGIADNNLVVKSSGGTGATNLAYEASATNGVVTSDTGTDATIPVATTSNAGLLQPSDKTKLNNTTGTNSGDNAPNTNSNAYTDAAIASVPSAPDATTTLKGKVKLAGDLAGTADLPTVPALANKANISGQVFTGNISAANLSGSNTGDNSPNTNSNAYTDAAIASVPSAPDATTTLKGKVKLAGDLSGTADLPTVPALANKANISGQVFTGNISAANLSGTNTGDNSPNTNSNAYADTKVASVTGTAVTGTSTNPIINNRPIDAFPTIGSPNSVSSNGVALRFQSVAFQSETVDYIDRMKAVNDPLTYSEATAYDDFVSAIKAGGFLSKIKFFAPIFGNTATGGRVKAIVDASGVSSMVNGGMLDTEYTKLYGFIKTTTSANTRHIMTGFIPSDNGLTTQNIGMGIIVASNVSYSGTTYIGDNPPAGQQYSINIAKKSLGLSGTVGTGLFIPVYPIQGKKVQFATFNGTNTAYSFLNGNNLGSDTSSFNIPLMSVTGEMGIYKYMFNTTQYSAGNVSGLIFTSSLTKTESGLLTGALQTLYEKWGRLPSGGNIVAVIGDSNAAGFGVSIAGDRWVNKLCSYLGATDLNLGLSGSQLLVRVNSSVDAGVASGMERYPTILDKPINTIIIALGTNDIVKSDTGNNNFANATILANYKAGLGTMVDDFKAKGTQVVLCSVLFAPPTASFTEGKFLDYVRVAYEVSQEKNVLFVDLYRPIAELDTPSQYYADIVHLNAAGNTIVANLILSVIKGGVQRQPVLDFPSIPAGGLATLPVTILGITRTNTVGVPNFPDLSVLGLKVSSYINTANTLTVEAYNPTNTTIDPPSSRGTVKVFLN